MFAKVSFYYLTYNFSLLFFLINEIPHLKKKNITETIQINSGFDQTILIQ